MRTYGTWYTYCAPAWTRDEAATICEALGFTQLSNWTAEHSPEVSMMIMTTFIAVLDDNCSMFQATYLNPEMSSSSTVDCSTLYLECG